MSNLESWKQFTQARIGLDRSGGSLSTKDVLRFRLDHARAKDAVIQEPNWDQLRKESVEFSKTYGIPSQFVKSQVTSKEEYLLRPDLGRRLSKEEVSLVNPDNASYDLSIVCIDGLSAKAMDENLIPFVDRFLMMIQKTKLSLAPLVFAKWGRVALGDEIASSFHAKLCMVVIGERPGLSSCDSLGIYLTYEPKLGNTDETRNCISNVRPLGYPIEAAVEKTIYLISESFFQKRSGVLLKDQMPMDTKFILGN